MADKRYSLKLILVLLDICLRSLFSSCFLLAPAASFCWMTVSLCAGSALASALTTQLSIQSGAAEVRVWKKTQMKRFEWKKIH